MKKILIIILIILIAVVAVGVFVLLHSHILENISTSLTIQDKQIADNTNPFVIKIAYPQINGLDDFNKKVEDIIDKEIKDFKTNSLENDAAVKQVDPESYAKYPRTYELDIGYDKGQVDNNIVSVVFNIYKFEGGAHGNSYFVPLNYDVKNKKEIALADLFPNQTDYLQKISAFCIADLTKQITTSLGSTDGTWIKDGAGPNPDNFQFFLINPSTSSGQATITFYFPQYQVAFGAAGDFTVTMPR
ncbi:MAG: DUF3298 and DUF4163 domain-containing protein [Candidatus Staskawiczbacteria bacterium]|nr:DUF3298 and DUF4163 domain-containing protein [Candidatus Staskawiczbacteria bacterium]